MEVSKRLLAAASLLLGLLAAIALGACGQTSAARSDQVRHSSASRSQTRISPAASSHTATASHVAVIVMENQEYGNVIGSPSAPFINRLARSYALAEMAYSTSHPSLPNYLALTGGSTNSKAYY